MKDNEIIKALKCCRDCKCKECPCYNKEIDGCKEIDEQDILDLINRKQAEIERLKDFCDIYSTEGERAIKEFAERLKPILFGYYDSDIDNLVKEMTEQKE
ncbi:MAG: hypothetical protein E7398_00110 [Ruminococcaceae bacterium]|nr:hypothetical protein [Oscillospiraceae bacterium]